MLDSYCRSLGRWLISYSEVNVVGSQYHGIQLALPMFVDCLSVLKKRED